MKKREFPDWSVFTAEAVTAELPQIIADANVAVESIEAMSGHTYETLVWRLNDATRKLYHYWGQISHLLGVMNSPEWRAVEEKFRDEVIAFSLRVGQSQAIYRAAKALLANDAETLDPTRKRILERMVQAAELAGVALEGEKRERFNVIQAKLGKLAADFSNAVIDATAAYRFEKDGKTYTIDDANYPITMKNCPDREVRENLCRARSVRAPENEARIAEILTLKQECADLLGFPDYAALSLATKCAPSVDAIMKMIDDLDVATVEPAAAEDAEIGPAEPWDVAYLAERLREKRYCYSEEELKKYFEFADVLAGLFRMTKFLFDIEIEEITGDAKPSVWHKDVRFFAVIENGETVAHFYLDPYVRPGQKQNGAWMNEFRNRDKRLAEIPLALIVLNLPVPDENGHTYMIWREVETLFHEFGHACQQMLTRVDEEDAAGINLVEWDAVEVASQFMENWCLDDRTGITVPEELKAKVRAAKNFRAATACRRQLALAKTDLMLHRAGVDPTASNAIKTEWFAHFGTPLVDEDRFLCAFTHIFCGGYSAGYYGYKWSEVMSADCFGAFEEAGLADDEAMRRIGSHYRETILALGGSIGALEVFRRFRGRDPQIDAILRQRGLR